ncbi:hypothetical protein VTN96DRAFT_3867 [Rasamsonia emersonii]
MIHYWPKLTMAMTLKSLHPLRYIEDAEDGDIPFVATPSAESTMAEIEECDPSGRGSPRSLWPVNEQWWKDRFEDCLKLHHIVESDILLTVDGLPSVTTAYYKEQLTVVQTVREFEDLSNNMSVPVLTRTLQGQAVPARTFLVNSLAIITQHLDILRTKVRFLQQGICSPRIDRTGRVIEACQLEDVDRQAIDSTASMPSKELAAV